MKPITIAVLTLFITLSLNAWGINDDKDLMMYLPFDEDVGDTSMDVSGNNLEAVLQGATWSKDGKFGSCIHIDAATKFAEVAAVPELDITDALTMQAWFLPEESQGDSSLMGRRTAGNVGNYCLQWSAQFTGAPQIETWININGWQGSRNKQTIKPALNEWHHVATTYDGDMIRQYIDGELDIAYTPPAGEINSVDVVFRIGQGQTNLGSMIGSVDEVAIYSRALSEDEINADMNKGVFFDVSPGGKLATTWADLKE